MKAGFGSVVKHPEAVDQKHLPTQGQVKITDAFSAATKMPNSSKRAKELTDAIGYFIAKDMQPVSVVQDAGFQYMVRTLEPRFQIPHRKAFMDRVLPSLYLKVKDTVMPCTAAAEWFAITADCWTSRANEAYIGVTFHTITREWELQHFVLENQELPEQHTAANIAEAMKNVLAQWGLDSSKLAGATVDNAANIQKAMVDILSWKCLGCFGHTINLCVKAGLKQRQVETAVARCSRLVTFFRKSSRAAHILQTKQEALEKPKHKLIQEVDTRWNSTYDMVERVMEQQVPICATLIEMKRMDLLPKDTECRLLEGVLKVLKPFKDVTVQVSAEKYVTTSAIQPLIHHLTQKALRVEDADSLAIKSMKQEMAKNLQSRYQEPAVKELLDFACFVDPRFKSMPFLDANKHEELHEDFVTEVMMNITPDAELDSDREQEDLEPPSKKAKTGLGMLLGDMFTIPATKKRMSIRERAEQEMHKYIHEPSPSVDANILQWWRQNCNRFPAIAEIARKRLCVPATSTPSERLFSKAGCIINSKRAALEPENASMLCFLAENLS